MVQPQELRFEIGPLPFAVRLPPGTLARSLADAWRPFTSEAMPETFVDVEIDERRRTPRDERMLPEVRAGEGGTLEVVGRDFEASISADLRSARIVQGLDRFPVESLVKLVLAGRLAGSGGLLVHGVAVAKDARAAVFTGPSGAGKSTLGALCAEAPGWLRLADELVAIAPAAEGYLAFGTPWNVGVPRAAALWTMGLLAWGDSPLLAPLPPARVLRVLLTNTLLPDPSPSGRAAVFRNAARLLERLPTSKLTFAREVGVARVLEEAMRFGVPGPIGPLREG